ncbi:hypothetical protein [Lacticaseibacillus paracasei]|uniref:hypothetical protein n=1 Tax=Lacticaseibacillus paracasei TaxID=1597 RepID=UPI0031F58AEB
MTEVVGHVNKQEIFEVLLWLSFVTKEQFEHQDKDEPLVGTDDGVLVMSAYLHDMAIRMFTELPPDYTDRFRYAIENHQHKTA